MARASVESSVLEADSNTKAFAKRLAANDKKTRDETLSALKKWIVAKTRRRKKRKSASEDPSYLMTDLDMLKLWKGLFYCIWMADKTPVQQELAENISEMILEFKTKQPEVAGQFIRGCFTTLQREWMGIDHLRLDKYYSFIRKFINAWLRYLQERNWQEKDLAMYKDIMVETVLQQKPDGLRFHVVDVFLPELAKVCKAQKNSTNFQTLQDIIAPFYSLLSGTKSQVLYEHTLKCIFNALPQWSESSGLNMNITIVSKCIFLIASETEALPSKQRDVLYDTYKLLKDEAKIRVEKGIESVSEEVLAGKPKPKTVEKEKEKKSTKKSKKAKLNNTEKTTPESATKTKKKKKQDKKAEKKEPEVIMSPENNAVAKDSDSKLGRKSNSEETKKKRKKKKIRFSDVHKAVSYKKSVKSLKTTPVKVRYYQNIVE